MAFQMRCGNQFVYRYVLHNFLPLLHSFVSNCFILIHALLGHQRVPCSADSSNPTYLPTNPTITKQKQRLRGRPAGTQTRDPWRVYRVFPVCYIAVSCVAVVPTTHSHNHIAIPRARPYLPAVIMCQTPKVEPVPSPPWEAGQASNPESTVTCVLCAFQVCSSPVLYTLQARGHNTHTHTLSLSQ